MKFLILVLTSVLFFGVPVQERAGVSREGVFEYRVLVKKLPANIKILKVWLPLPSDNPRQKIGKIFFESSLDFKIKKEGEYQNRYAYAKIKKPNSGPLDIAVRIPFTRFEVDQAGPLDLKKGNIQRFLQADKLVPLDQGVKKEASKIQAGEEPQSRRIYNYVVESMRYDKSGTGWGRGDFNRACDVRTGNCTDFHSMFIGLARVSGIAARFIMGVPLPVGKNGIIKGYHCWAEFWNTDRGWIPVDASEAYKNPDKKEQFYGGLDADRLEFSRGRDVKLSPLPSQGRLNYFFYPLIEIDDRPFDNYELQLSVSKKDKS